MIRNYLKIAWRNLTKDKLYSLINISGLAIGLAAFLFIVLYVVDEISYDSYHPYSERTYRVDVDAKLGDQVVNTAENGAPVGPTMQADFPEVKSFCRFRNRGSFTVKYGNRAFKEDDIIYADSTFFKVFGVSMLIGSPEQALVEPNSIVLTSQMAKKYFGDDPAIGKPLTIGDRGDYKVTGVMDKIPSNTHFHFDFILSMSTLEESKAGEFGSMNFATYIVLQEDLDLQNFMEKVNDHLVTKYFAPEVQKYIGMSWEEFEKGGNSLSYELFPIEDIHLHSSKDNEIQANGDIKYIWIFSITGLFILFIACINFMNLYTARSTIRAKEIGVRKTVGAGQMNLIVQFLSESVLVSLIALAFAWCIIYFMLQDFNHLAGKSFTANQVLQPGFILASLAIAIFTGLFAGSYPAAVLARFRPLDVLRGIVAKNQSKPHFRNSLVVFQFLVTAFLLCGMLIVTKQLNFIQNKKLGYDKDQLMLIDNNSNALGNNVEAFKDKLLSFSAVEQATISGFLPVPSNNNNSYCFKGREQDMNNAVLTNNWVVDYDYINTMRLEIIQGRNFSRSMSTDSIAIIINERLASYYEGDPIGQELSNPGYQDGNIVTHHIIGVVKDFNFESLRQNIEPLAIRLGRSNDYITIRIGLTDLPELIKSVESAWNEMTPGQPFSYAFMDERFENMYRAERRIGKIIGLFAILGIFIACIGLVGLSTFMVLQRSKEIGVRKVLGASSTSIVQLLSKDFLKPVLIALLMAIPLSWWAMGKWLEGFAYRTNISLDIFFGTAIGIVLLTFLTVSFQSLRAALSNPVDSLRSE
jgi:putative ABC transport system permease protein